MLCDEDRQTLLQVARESIRQELYAYVALNVEASDYGEALADVRASFVTLKMNHQLRGCIGTIQAQRPLVVDVARNAGAAACSDPRFPRLSRDEFDKIEIHVSILSPSEPLAFANEQALLTQIRPGTDGLILIDGVRRATFLPDVWQQLPEPRQFLEHMKQKAGLLPDHWSDSLQVLRYTTESFP